MNNHPTKNNLLGRILMAAALLTCPMAHSAEPFTNSNGMKMIWVKPGSNSNITKGYYLAATETSQAQWERIMGSNPSDLRGEDLPVETVSWEDAMEFCKKLTAIEHAAGKLPKGYVYALPTEAQWDYARRAGRGGDYVASLASTAWFKNNSGGTTHSVGTKQANAWGFHDMDGNVSEWCFNKIGDARVGRGGTFQHDEETCLKYERWWNLPIETSRFIGFRAALVPRE